MSWSGTPCNRLGKLGVAYLIRVAQVIGWSYMHQGYALRPAACMLHSPVLMSCAQASLELISHKVEVHFTRSQQEHYYALCAYLAQMINSIFILLLVNASYARNAAANSTVGSTGTQCLHVCAVHTKPYAH